MNLKEITRHLFEEENMSNSRMVPKYPTGLTHVQMGTRIHNDLEKAMTLGASLKQACAMLDLPEPEDGKGEAFSTVTGRVRSEEPNLMEIAKPDKLVRYNEADVDSAKKAMSLWEPPLLSLVVPSSASSDIDALRAHLLSSLGIPEKFFNETYPPAAKAPSLTSPRELAMSPCIGGGMAKDHPASFMPRPTPKPKRAKAEGTFSICEEAANTAGAQERLAYAKGMFKDCLVIGVEEQPRLIQALEEKRLGLHIEMCIHGTLHFSTCDFLHVPGLYVKFGVSTVAANLSDAWEVLIEGLSR